jgi:HAMP domain-containing protein
MKRIEGRLANLATEVASSDWTVSTTAPQSADSRTAKVKETLDGLEQSVALLAERLEIHALETFSVD